MASPVVQLRVPPDLLARIDEHRGEVTRSEWFLAAASAALEPKWTLPPAEIAVPPGQYMGGAPARPSRSRNAGAVAPEDDHLVGRLVPRRGSPHPPCTHPKSRVIKGYCGACGTGGLG